MIRYLLGFDLFDMAMAMVMDMNDELNDDVMSV